MSEYAEQIRKETRDIAVALRDVHHLIKYLNTCLTVIPNARELMTRDVRSARSTYRKFVSARRWSIDRGRRPNDGEFIITGNDARSYENALTVLSLSRFYRFLSERERFPDQDPMRMDPQRSRLVAGTTRLATKDEEGRVTVDTDLMFRTPQAQRIAPRTGDPFFLEKILKAGDLVQWPFSVRTLVEAKGLTGGRDFQLRTMPVYNWLVLGKGDFIHAPGKFSRGKLVIRLRVCSRLKASLIRLMDETYPELGGYEGLRRIAASKVRRDELLKLFIFTLNGKTAISYSCVNDQWFRPAIEQAGLCVEDLGDGNEGPVLRWVTQHWLRHEFTNKILQQIEESGLSAKDRMVQKILLARYMGWKSAQAMLEYYGRWFFNKEADIFIAAQMEAANDNSLPAAMADWVDDETLTPEDLSSVKSVMGGLLRTARG